MRAPLAFLALLVTIAACGGGGDTSTPTFDLEGDMRLTSSAFTNEMRIPSKHTCDGEDVSPELFVSDPPAGTGALVLIVEDPDAPRGTWDHWVLYDIPVADRIPEGANAAGTDGVNSWGSAGYRGPCPPGGAHRYVFTMYALDSPLGLASGADKARVLAAMEGHVLDGATLLGRYSR